MVLSLRASSDLRCLARVANITEDGRYAGPQAQTLAVAERLKFHGMEAIVVCPERDSQQFLSEALDRGIEIRLLPISRLSRNPRQVVRYLLTFPNEILSLYRLLKKERVDVVHCNSARQLKGVVVGCFLRKKIIWHLQDTFSPAVVRALFFMLAPFVDCFITAGRKVQQYYLSRFPLYRKPVKVIQAPVDVRRFSAGLIPADERIGRSPGVKIVSVGNVNPAKGFEYFIEAASIIDTGNRALSFWIVGPRFETQKKYIALLDKRCKDLNVKIHFYGASADVRSVLEAADIYVCSSVHEASPISVWEAMAMEKPIVSTDVGDVARYIRDGEDGFIVPPRNARTLAEKVEVLVKNESLRKQFASRVRKIAVENFDVDICARKHVQAYEMVLD